MIPRFAATRARLRRAARQIRLGLLTTLPARDMLRHSANRLGVKIVVPYLGRYRLITNVDIDSIHALETGTYSEAEIAFARQFAGPDMTIADIGANIGYFSVAFADILQTGGGCIHCFEPTPETYEILCDNLALGRFPSRVATPNRIALYDGSADDLLFYGYDPKYNSVYNGMAPAQFNRPAGRIAPMTSFRVPATTLDRYCEEKQIERFDLIKMDVEGAECEVLVGGREVIRRSLENNVFTMILEVNDDSQRARHLTARALLEQVTELGFELGEYNATKNIIQPHTVRSDHYAPVNIICCSSISAVNQRLRAQPSPNQAAAKLNP